MQIHRRSLLQLAPFSFLQTAVAAEGVPGTYPSHSPAIAREIVGASHGNLARVKELVNAQPTLALASWDWGFGDWETALGAASHVGNRAIAEILIENGAPPTLFSASMLGQLEVVKALIESHSGLQRLAGPHSISLLDHARAGGPVAKPVFDYLYKLGNAGAPAQVPLSDEAKASIVGTYTFGPGASDRIEITIRKPHVELQRAGGDARRLFHLGDLTFHPAGARAVRIHFDGKGELTIHDPTPILIGRRTN